MAGSDTNTPHNSKLPLSTEKSYEVNDLYFPPVVYLLQHFQVIVNLLGTFTMFSYCC